MFEDTDLMFFFQKAWCDGNQEAVKRSVAKVCSLCDSDFEVTYSCLSRSDNNIDLYKQCLIDSGCFDEVLAQDAEPSTSTSEDGN